jgi:[ribosomal protein S5]-alanine N-acetyltransferase
MFKRIICRQGRLIDLCVLNQERHLGKCLKWFNNPAINLFLTVGWRPVTEKAELEWFDNIAKDDANIVMAIETRKKEYIGNVGLHKINYRHRKAEMGIIIGEKSYWGKGIATEAEIIISEYGFRHLNLRKIYAGIVAENIGSIKAAKKAGFKEEGILREHLFIDGRYRDIVQLAIFNPVK